MSTSTIMLVLVSSNIACAFLGFLFGRMTRAAVTIEDHMSTGDEIPPVTDSPTRRRRRVTAIQVMAGALVFIGVATTALGIVLTRNQDRIVGCLVGYSNASSVAIKAGRAAQNKVNDQLDNVMGAFQSAFTDSPAEGRDRVFKAIDAYNRVRTEAKRVQRENPLPDAPENACAELLG